ncbi:MAG: hypothetical protein FRX49_00884 [Trebouxia sp. A1-2]|nr:MAG: hypothetical protein FRX49_00884 [Trebouxia sp. A1-2]
MPFATADKSESPLDSAWAMGEKLMSSKELMDPADNLLFHVLGENEAPAIARGADGSYLQQVLPLWRNDSEAMAQPLLFSPRLDGARQQDYEDAANIMASSQNT